jgi:hypothetical protein
MHKVSEKKLFYFHFNAIMHIYLYRHCNAPIAMRHLRQPENHIQTVPLTFSYAVVLQELSMYNES